MTRTDKAGSQQWTDVSLFLELVNASSTAIVRWHVLTVNRASLHTEVSSVCASPLLNSDELQMALRARNVSGTFEKRAPGSSG